jgi:hypothetical protein
MSGFPGIIVIMNKVEPMPECVAGCIVFQEHAMREAGWTPAELLRLSNGYWSACALHAAVKLDLFTALSACPFAAPDLADAAGIDPRGLEILLNALSAMGLVEKVESRFSATAFSAKYLSQTSPHYLGHSILHHHYLMSSWAHLDEAVRGGEPVRARYAGSDEARVLECFEMGMFELGMLNAPAIVSRIDLGGRSRLLDLGGGPGAYAVTFCRGNPGVMAMIFDLPTTRRFAEETIVRFGLADRITFVAGDYLTGQIPGRHDIAWLSHVLHGEGPEACKRILEKVVASLEPAGMVLIQEFILNDTMDWPPFPALFSLNMLLGTRSGRAYSEGQLLEMLAEAGVRNPLRLPIELPNGAGVIAGEVP